MQLTPSLAELAAGIARPLRLLGVARISRLTDASTSIERQIEDEERHAAAIGGVIVGWAKDPDVSASKTGPFKRPELGDWLKNRKDEFDGIIVWKLDRIIRSGADLRELLLYLTQHNKRLISVKEAVIDFDPTSKDKLKRMICDIFMTVATIIAEMEAENISMRVKSARGYLIRSRYWPAGSPPYGYKLERGLMEGEEKPGMMLVPDPDAIGVINEIIDMVLGRDGVARAKVDAIAKHLTAKGVLPPYQQRRVNRGDSVRGSIHWHGSTVTDVITNPMLVGEYTKKTTVTVGGRTVRTRETVRDEHGAPLVYGKPIIDRAVFDAVQAELTGRMTAGRGPLGNAEFLSGAIECGECGAPLYFWRHTTKANRTYLYYRCGNRNLKKGAAHPCPVGFKTLRADLVHEFLDEHIKAELAAHPLTERVFIPGTGSHDEIAQVKSAIDTLVADRAKGEFSGYLEKVYLTQLESYGRRLEELEAAGVQESRWETRTTGRTLADEWESADWARRRELLGMAGLRLQATPGTRVMHIVVEEATASRLGDLAATLSKAAETALSATESP